MKSKVRHIKRPSKPQIYKAPVGPAWLVRYTRGDNVFTWRARGPAQRWWP